MARSITVALELDDRGFNRGIRSADQQVNKLSSGFGGLKTVIGAATAVASGFAVKGILDAQLQMEGFRSTLTAYLGSQNAANDAIGRLSTLSKSLSQDLPEVTEAFIILKRNGIDTANESLTAFSKIALGNSKSFTQLSEAVADALMGEFERLKEFGVKVSKENDQFVMRYADGSTKIVDSAQEVVAAFKSQGEAGGQFYTATAGPLTQALSNLKGVIFEASTAFSAGFAPALEEAAVSLSAVIEANKEAIASFGRLIGEGLQWFLENMDSVVTGIKAFAAAWVAIKFAELVQGLVAVRGAILALNVAIMANPIGALAAAIAAAAVLIVTYWDDIAAGWDRAKLQITKGMLQLKVFMYDVFGPAIQWVSDQFTSLQANAVGTFAGIKALGEDFSLDSFVNAFNKAEQAVLDTAAAERTMADEVADANARIEEINSALSENAENTADVEAAAEDAAAAVNKHKTANQAALPAMADMAAASGEVCEAAKKEAKCVSAATEALNKKTKAEERAAAQAQRVISGSSGRLAGQVKELENQRELLDYYGEERQVKESLNRIERDRADAIARIEALEDYPQKAEDLKKVNEQFDAQLQKVEDLEREIYDYQRTFEYGFKEAFNKFKEDSTNAATLAGDLFESAATDWRNAWVEAANTGKLSFDDLLGNMKNRIVAFLADAAFVKLTEVLAGAFGIDLGGKTAGSGASSGGSGGSGSSSSGGSGNIIDKAVDFVKGLFGFEKGGYVAGNRSVIVGEKGPEIFTPAGSGTIIPNFAGMQGSGQTVVYNINAVDSKSFVTMLTKHPDVIHGMVSARNAQMMGGRF